MKAKVCCDIASVLSKLDVNVVLLKRRKKRRLIWLMYLLFKNKFKIFKLVEITIRRGLK
jgi:hypothetical protein